jgi:hypothetical protein
LHPLSNEAKIKMKYVVFAPANLSPEEMVVASQANEDGIAAHGAEFAGITNPVAILSGQRSVVSGKIAAETAMAFALKELTKQKHTESDKLGGLVLQNANFVDTIAIADPINGDTIANQAGFNAKHGATHTATTPPASTHFSVAIGVHIGEVNLHCDAIHGFGTITYKYYYSLNVTVFDWVLGDAGGNSMILHGQETDVPIAYKVVGSNVNGAGADSAVIIKTLPKA